MVDWWFGARWFLTGEPPIIFVGDFVDLGGIKVSGCIPPKKHPKTNRQSPQDKDRILACAPFPFCNKDCYIRVGCAVQIEPSIALRCLQSQACLNLDLSFIFQQQACGDLFGVFPFPFWCLQCPFSWGFSGWQIYFQGVSLQRQDCSIFQWTPPIWMSQNW